MKLLVTLACLLAAASAVDLVARIYPRTGSTVSGFVTWTFDQPDPNNATITMNLAGFTPASRHSMHVHVYGDMTDPLANIAGGHFAGMGTTTHGCFPSPTRHAGDIIFDFTSDGSGNYVDSFVRDLQAKSGANSIVGRSVIVHASFDDCTTQPTGNAGARHGQGVIGTAQGGGGGAGNSAPGNFFVAYLAPTTAGANTNGTVWLRPSTNWEGLWQVSLKVEGIVPSTTHGFHIHEFGDLTVNNATYAGNHLNPAGNPHALPSETVTRHMGDLGNVVADANGRIDTTFLIGALVNTDIVGKAVILHLNADQGQSSQPVGNAGSRIGMGVVGIANPLTGFPPDVPFVPYSSSSTGMSSSTGLGAAGTVTASAVVTLGVIAAALVAVARQ